MGAMMTRSLFLATIAASTMARIQEESYYRSGFESWKAKFEVRFLEEEEATRFQIWADNDDMITQHNLEGHSWTMGHNEFSHLSKEEFRTRVGLGRGFNPPNVRRRPSDHNHDLSTAALPDTVDWTTKGAVTDVKDQAECGSCWAFSTTGSTEGALFLATGKLVSLSEEQLVDCDTTDDGCDGGLEADAMKWIKSNGGICSEADYAYTAGPSGKASSCKKGCSPVATVGGVHEVTPNEDALKAAVALTPVSVAIEAVDSMQMYSGGVFNSTCGTDLDHAVLAVGYGTDSGSDYWKVKNSWGASWGEGGYIRMSRGAGAASGLCGIAMSAHYPTGVAAATGGDDDAHAGDDTPPSSDDDTPSSGDDDDDDDDAAAGHHDDDDDYDSGDNHFSADYFKAEEK